MMCISNDIMLWNVHVLTHSRVWRVSHHCKYLPLVIHGSCVMSDILQQVSSGYLSSWSSIILTGSFWGLVVCSNTWNVWHWLFIISGNILDILQHISSGYLFNWSSTILRVPLNTPHNHTCRPSVPCTGSHTIWRDAIRNWLPFQLAWTL